MPAETTNYDRDVYQVLNRLLMDEEFENFSRAVTYHLRERFQELGLMDEEVA